MARIDHQVALLHPARKALHDLLMRGPVRHRQAMRQLGITSTSLRWHAWKLAQAGFLIEGRDGAAIVYEAGPALPARAAKARPPIVRKHIMPQHSRPANAVEH